MDFVSSTKYTADAVTDKGT